MIALKSRVSFITDLLLGLAALLVGGRVVWDMVETRNVATPWAPVAHLTDWESLVSDGRITIRSTSSKINVVVFSDFECPFCRRLQQMLADVAPEFPEMLVVFRHLPLETIHKNARNGANAAECAQAQGRFGQFHDTLFSRQGQIGDLSWNDIAALAGVNDLEEFSRCVQEAPFDSLVTRDSDLAAKLNFSAAPTVIIDGTVFRGSPPDASVLRQTLQRALDGSG